MRTAIIILGGFFLWGACLGFAKLVQGANPSAMTVATGIFVSLWFIAAAVNMWLGVTQAGYSFMEELPIFLLIFGLPAAAAIVLKWKFL